MMRSSVRAGVEGIPTSDAGAPFSQRMITAVIAGRDAPDVSVTRAYPKNGDAVRGSVTRFSSPGNSRTSTSDSTPAGAAGLPSGVKKESLAATALACEFQSRTSLEYDPSAVRWAKY